MSAARNNTKVQHRSGVAALLVAAAVVGGCDGLLEVELPDAVTESALTTPNTAALQVNSIMALFECGYSSLALKAAGYEDNFQRVSGVAGLYSEYETIPAGGNCDSGAAYSSAWMNAMLQARATGYSTYDRIGEWTDAEVTNRQQLLAKAALYTALPLGVLGEFFCEMAVDAGPLMTPVQTLDLALSWVDKANGHISQTGDFAVTATAGNISPSIQTMSNGLKARLLWAKGDLAGAATEAAKVQNGFVAWVLREEGEDRRNIVAAFQGGAQQAAGFLQGPVRLRTEGLPYGVTYLGNNPVSGQPWPNPVPVTGYLNLDVDAAMVRAVSDEGHALTTATAGTVADTRVQHRIGNTAGGQDNIVSKYTQNTDDIHLINWKEMRLIQAQYQNEVVKDQAAAIALVNQLRTADNLPIVQGAYASGATEASVRDMILEERRRALWLEARFWSTKIQNPDKLWFPRNEGDWTNSAQYRLNGGVRVMLPQNEYQINPNLSLDDRGTGCAAAQAPVFN